MSTPALRTQSAFDAGTHQYGLEVVGESHYQPNLRRALNSAQRGSDGEWITQVIIHRERNNPHDENAVQVTSLDGRCLGYLSRERAVGYKRVLKTCGEAGLTVGCRARFAGGEGDKPSIGIWLDLAFPGRLAAMLKENKQP